jgi:hypothetical protein
MRPATEVLLTEYLKQLKLTAILRVYAARHASPEHGFGL